MTSLGHVSFLEVDFRHGHFPVRSKAVSRDWTEEMSNRGSSDVPTGAQIWKIQPSSPVPS